VDTLEAVPEGGEGEGGGSSYVSSLSGTCHIGSSALIQYGSGRYRDLGKSDLLNRLVAPLDTDTHTWWRDRRTKSIAYHWHQR
jgi:hypothetical protein